MGRRPDQGKEQFWRRLLRQWRCSGLTIRAFCAKHAVRVPSFYFWRRTIAQRDRQSGRNSPTPTTAAAAPPPVFVPVRVVPAPAAAALEVVLGQGRVVRVPAGFDPATLRQLLALLEEEPSC